MGISKLINDISQCYDSDQTLYFRGQRDKDFLLPKLLRTKNEIDLIKENHLYCNSWVMGNEEISNARNSWEVLSKMQHYGISTRLLDWSSSLIAAIFFAIDECRDCLTLDDCHKKKKKGCRGNPVIWVLNPGVLHNQLYPKLDILSFTIGIDNMVPDYCKSFITNKIKWKYNN
ncbi:MAG: FRG domain-containing protein [Paludibacter sp.]|nr:FRG domain-containing protein [Paludibacter sp.]